MKRRLSISPPGFVARSPSSAGYKPINAAKAAMAPADTAQVISARRFAVNKGLEQNNAYFDVHPWSNIFWLREKSRKKTRQSDQDM
jgi:hypothetical protein